MAANTTVYTLFSTTRMWIDAYDTAEGYHAPHHTCEAPPQPNSNPYEPDTQVDDAPSSVHEIESQRGLCLLETVHRYWSLDLSASFGNAHMFMSVRSLAYTHQSTTHDGEVFPSTLQEHGSEEIWQNLERHELGLELLSLTASSYTNLPLQRAHDGATRVHGRADDHDTCATDVNWTSAGSVTHHTRGCHAAMRSNPAQVVDISCHTISRSITSSFDITVDGSVSVLTLLEVVIDEIKLGQVTMDDGRTTFYQYTESGWFHCYGSDMDGNYSVQN